MLGITGPPGVGKSTLTGVLIAEWRKSGRNVGVLAVDPSSQASGGALLGDRARIAADPDDAGVFIRSLAARDRLGGLADLALPAATLMAALYEVLVVETVGVGQSETEITQLADTVPLCVPARRWRQLQFMKAGIAETPDVVAVTKADLGQIAVRAAADVRAAFGHAIQGDWAVPVLPVSSQQRRAGRVDRVHRQARGLAARRGPPRPAPRGPARHWLEQMLRDRFGRSGLQRAGSLDLTPGRVALRALEDDPGQARLGFFFAFALGRLVGLDTVLAAEPFRQVDIGAALRAERRKRSTVGFLQIGQRLFKT